MNPKTLYLIGILNYFIAASVRPAPPTISIRGNSQMQYLPRSMASSWPSWTFENGRLDRVDDDGNDGWVNPTSFENLYLPSDLPTPVTRPALGVLVANGSPRYVFPSIVLTLETPDRAWRNRGLCSLPRSHTWIDLFSPFIPRLENLQIHCYGQSSPELRFLEDQDGEYVWTDLYAPASSSPGGIFSKPLEGTGLEFLSAYNNLRTYLQRCPYQDVLSSGYHFIDVILPTQMQSIKLPQNRIKMYLTDLEEPRQLINMEGSYDDEVLGELDITISAIGPGGISKYLPKVYYDLYDSGNILYS